MKLALLYLIVWVKCCLGIVLGPLENNDNLKHITKQFVAEWQWESWPVKKETKARENQTPGARINVALWKEPSRLAWYLFGGQPVDNNIKKVYSDIWKYSVEKRTWEKFFPHLSGVKNQDGMMSFRSDFLNNTTEPEKLWKNFRFFLCGEMGKINRTKPKNRDLWSTYYKRKKPEKEETEELESLALYVPQSSKPITVWQMDVRNNSWTSYVCSCDPTDNCKANFMPKSFKSKKHKLTHENAEWGKNFKIEKNITAAENESSIFDSKINKVEDIIDNLQQHLSIKNLNKKKKINQYKKGAESLRTTVKYQRKRNVDKMEIKSNESKLEKVSRNNTENFLIKKNYTKGNNANKKKELSSDLGEEQLNGKRKEDAFKLKNAKMMMKHCPENLKNDEPVTWCDGKSEALITADISSFQIILWVFNLKTAHWIKMKVKFSDRDKWSLCSDINVVRYAAAGEEVYLVCTPQNEPNDEATSSNSSTDSLGILKKNNFVRKLVFRINYKNQILDCLGEIKLNSYFGTLEGEAAWRNISESILHAVKNSNNETILILAYLNVVDLWILTRDSKTKEYFDLTEKIWRGSALKWFDKYNAAFYNFQFISESGEVETVLIQNPRSISVNEYWKTERGRFIIRIYKNENLKNQSSENRTREQNLTYELLQSDNKPSEVKSQFSFSYGFLLFFVTLFVFLKIVGFILLLIRLYIRPRQDKVRKECRKSLIIKYSVISDNLLHPVK